MGGLQNWVQMKSSDLDDPDLKRPGGFRRQVHARIVGSVIMIAFLVALGIFFSSGA